MTREAEREKPRLHVVLLSQVGGEPELGCPLGKAAVSLVGSVDGIRAHATFPGGLDDRGQRPRHEDVGVDPERDAFGGRQVSKDRLGEDGARSELRRKRHDCRMGLEPCALPVREAAVEYDQVVVVAGEPSEMRSATTPMKYRLSASVNATAG